MKKQVKLAIAIALLLVAAIILFRSYGPRIGSSPVSETYICEECGHQFTPDWKALLKQHPDLDKARVQESNLPIPCPKCGKKRAREATVCPKCKKPFLTLKDGERCPNCGYKF